MIKVANIMIVEDNEDMTESLKDIVEKEGHKAKLAYNGKEFLSKIEEVNPDLVLLDVLMPGMKFKEILKKLREKKPEVKIILVTAILFSEEELNHLKKENNIVDYITKPFSVVNLLNKLNEAL